ncbi:MAG: protein kinase domain-containing protein, partial [Thermoanaerobaculia bacterium]
MKVSPSPQPQGAIAGRYAIRRRLGAGSLGTVYLVHDAVKGRAVALKLLRTDRLSAEAVRRFQGEFGALASLEHPRLAAAYDFGYSGAGDLPYYTREYIEGRPLPAGPPGAAEPREFLRPILDLLEALEHLHRHGILHLDVHPGNLIVAGEAARGSVLIDFGLFRSLDPIESSLPARVLGPLPPEVARRGRARPATDLFLAGRLLLYRLAGGECG